MSQQHHVVAHNMYNPYLWKHYVMDPLCYMAAAIGEPNAAMLRAHSMSCKDCPECMIPVYDAVTKRHCFCNMLNRAAVRLCTTTNGDGTDNVFRAVSTQKVHIRTTAINNIIASVINNVIDEKSHDNTHNIKYVDGRILWNNSGNDTDRGGPNVRNDDYSRATVDDGTIE